MTTIHLVLLQQTEAPDSTFAPSKGKKPQEVDIHKRFGLSSTVYNRNKHTHANEPYHSAEKTSTNLSKRFYRCLDETQERLIMLQDLTQVTLKLRMEFEMEADLRRRAVDECEEQKRKRTDAEQLVRDFQNLCEKQADDYRSTVGSLQVEVRTEKANKYTNICIHACILRIHRSAI